MPRILITRSAGQTSTLAEALSALGAEPILIPTIALAPPTSFCPLDAALAQLPSYHWLLFTSANAVTAFAHRARRTFTPHPTQQVAAIGPATAAALRDIGLPPTLIPPTAVAESLTAALLPHATQPSGSPTRMLLLRAEHARDHLPETLRAAGADLSVAPVYRNLIPTESIPLLQVLFASPVTWPDAVTFTSSSTATNLLTLLDAAHLTLPEPILRASIGPITSATLRTLNLPPHIESPESNIPSLVRTLAQALHLPHP